MASIFPKAANQAKKTTLKETLFCQNTPQWERSIIIGNKNNVVRSNIKQPSPEKNPTKFVFTPHLTLT
jgi:hypothetical protein